MSFQNKINNIPIPMDPERGAELAQSWGASGVLADALTGIGGCSPFLFDTLMREKEWIMQALAQDDPIADLQYDFAQGGDVPTLLRQAKRRVAGVLGFAELTHMMPVMQATQHLTNFADFAVQAAFDHSIAPYIAGGKLSAHIPWFVIAMGKMGAHELNYSSDIDLIVLYDDTDMDFEQSAEVRKYMLRACRAAVKALNEARADGYVFRTDLRLRPNPSVTPICIGTQSALQYYESMGRTWERAAFIKARICAGDQAAGNQFLQNLTPFVWRRHLDFAAIEELHDLRKKIRTHRGFGDVIKLEGHNVKLGRGGIREIEFFTQIQQLIAGGRDPDLRAISTLGGLAALRDKDWIAPDQCTALSQIYTRHRHSEHCLQMLRDAQTHSLPESDIAIARIAAMQGKSLDEFCTQTLEDLEYVDDTANGFFGASDGETTDILVSPNPEITENWLQYPALRSQRAVESFEKIKPQILNRLADAHDPQQAILNFDAFLRGLPAGVQLFAMFVANPKLIELICDIASLSPALSNYLARNSNVLDAFVSGAFFTPWPEPETLLQEFQDALAGADDYEDQLNLARIWVKEKHFKIGVHVIKDFISPHNAAKLYAQLAWVAAQGLFEAVKAHFASKYGVIAGAKVSLIAMGSMGAMRFTSESDMDLMVMFDAPENQQSDGRRSLDARLYYTRLTQALITALSADMAKGRLYEVDMRLRPSGKSGPVATSLPAFSSYQLQQAWTWEHFALTLLRPVSTDVEFAAQIDAVRRTVITQKRDWQAVCTDLQDMRVRLSEHKPSADIWDVKLGAGGLQDIELLAQAVGLGAQVLQRNIADQFAGGVAAGLMQQSDCDGLLSVHAYFSDIKLLHTLLCMDRQQTYDMGPDGWGLVQRHCGVENIKQLQASLAQKRLTSIDIIENILKQGA